MEYFIVGIICATTLVLSLRKPFQRRFGKHRASMPKEPVCGGCVHSGSCSPKQGSGVCVTISKRLDK